MDKRIASPRIRTDHAARSLIQNLEALERELGIAEAVVYYDFPIFRDESDKLYKPQVVLASRSHGIVLFAISNDILAADTDWTAPLKLETALHSLRRERSAVSV